MEIEMTIPEILDATDHDILIMHGFIKPRALCWSDVKREENLLGNMALISKLAREIREREDA